MNRLLFFGIVFASSPVSFICKQRQVCAHLIFSVLPLYTTKDEALKACLNSSHIPHPQVTVLVNPSPVDTWPITR